MSVNGLVLPSGGLCRLNTVVVVWVQFLAGCPSRVKSAINRHIWLERPIGVKQKRSGSAT